MKRIFRLILVIALLLSVVDSYGAVGFFAVPKVRIWNSTGTALLTQGYLVFCPIGTSCGCTSYTAGAITYTDSTGVTPNTNPVYLDSQGQASIWYSGTYKVTACDRFGNLQWSLDNVPSVTLFSSSGVSEYLPSNLTPTFISTTQFSVVGDYHLTFAQGRRLQITMSSGTNYYTVSTSSFALGITTVTVLADSLSLDSGISVVNTGILNVTNPSTPIRPVVTKTGSYSGTAADCGSTLEFTPTSTMTYTVPSASAVPSGCNVATKNTSTWTVTVGGTVEGVSNPSLTGQYSQMTLFSDGTSWYGKPISSTPAANTVPVSNATRDLLDRNSNPLFGMALESSATGSPNAFSPATLNLGTVTTGDRIYISAAIMGGVTASAADYLAIQVSKASGSATIIFKYDQSNIFNMITGNTTTPKSNIPCGVSDILQVTGSGTLVMQAVPDAGGGAGISDNNIYAFFLKKQ